MNDCANESKDIDGKTCCGATEYKKCRENCAFYISKENAKISLEKSNARLNTLTATEQLGISEKYYDGKTPWKRRESGF